MAEMTQRLITLTLNQSHDFWRYSCSRRGALADADALQSADCDRLTTKTSFKSLSFEAGEECVFSHWGGCLKFFVKSVRGLPDVILQVGFNMYKYFAAG
jgi:hypothetical protein